LCELSPKQVGINKW